MYKIKNLKYHGLELQIAYLLHSLRNLLVSQKQDLEFIQLGIVPKQIEQRQHRFCRQYAVDISGMSTLEAKSDMGPDFCVSNY